MSNSNKPFMGNKGKVKTVNCIASGLEINKYSADTTYHNAVFLLFSLDRDAQFEMRKLLKEAGPKTRYSDAEILVSLGFHIMTNKDGSSYTNSICYEIGSTRADKDIFQVTSSPDYSPKGILYPVKDVNVRKPELEDLASSLFFTSRMYFNDFASLGEWTRVGTKKAGFEDMREVTEDGKDPRIEIVERKVEVLDIDLPHRIYDTLVKMNLGRPNQ
ncbi:MAG: hypothetical protein ABII01_03750 [Candidatus Woesearchaeota archaeon]